MCACFLLPLLFHIFVVLPSLIAFCLSRRLECTEYGWCKIWIAKKSAHVLVSLCRQHGKSLRLPCDYFCCCPILFVIHPQTHWHNKITRLKPNQVLLWLVIQFFNFAHEITTVWHPLYVAWGFASVLSQNTPHYIGNFPIFRWIRSRALYISADIIHLFHILDTMRVCA